MLLYVNFLYRVGRGPLGLLESLEFTHNLNLKKIGLKGLKDFNIIIGPNNCGKTSILKGIALLQRIHFDRVDNLSCSDCKDAFSKDGHILSLECELGAREGYLGETKASMFFGHNANAVKEFLPKIAERRDRILNSATVFPTLVSRESRMKEELHGAKEMTDLDVIAAAAKEIVANNQDFAAEERLAKVEKHSRRS